MLLIQSQHLVAACNTLSHSLNPHLPNLAVRVFILDTDYNSTKLLNDPTVSSILFLITYGTHCSYCLKDKLQSVIHLYFITPSKSYLFFLFGPCPSHLPVASQTFQEFSRLSLHMVFPLLGSIFPRSHITCSFMLFRSLFKCHILRILSRDHAIPITPESPFPSLFLQP